MSYEHIILEYDSPRIARIRLNRPKAFNALNTALLRELTDALAALRAQPDLRAVIITGEGRAFAAGADIQEMRSMTAVEGMAFGALGSATFRDVECLPVPVIAAVNGFALGGGCELAMACDIRLASESAVFAQPEVGLGITPGFGGTARLPRLVGQGIASELILTGRKIDAAEARRIGLVNHVYAPAELLPEAQRLAEQIAAQAPVAVRASKECIRLSAECALTDANAHESALFGLCFSTRDQKRGMESFLQKAQCDFEGQ